MPFRSFVARCLCTFLAVLPTGTGSSVSLALAESEKPPTRPTESSAAPLASARARPVGTARGSGQNSRINSAMVVSDVSVYAGDRLRIGTGEAAALRLAGGVVLASEGTEAVVQEDGVRLEHGRIQVQQERSGRLAVEGAFFRVRLVARDGVRAAAEIVHVGAEARVTPMRGGAEVRTPSGPDVLSVRQGQTLVLRLPHLASSQTQSAGLISRLAPDVQVLRGSEQLAASEGATLQWGDEVRSGSVGRARVTLDDGTVLHVGPDSSLRLARYDAGAQQTRLQLNYGRLRWLAPRPAGPGASLEVRTPMGVAGSAGGESFLFATQDFTQLTVLDGEVRFTSVLTGQSVLAHAGQKAVISKYGAIEGLVEATPEEIQQARATTGLPESPTPPARPTPAKVAGAAHRTPIIVGIAAAGAVTAIVVPLAMRGKASPASPSAAR